MLGRDQVTLRLVLLLGTISLIGCSVFDDLKSMKKNMGELKGKMESDVGHLAKRADDLEREMAFKESSAMFNYFMELLFGERDREARTATGMPETAMLLYAEGAVRALLFQFWKGDYFEAFENELDQRFELSMAMVFARINDYIPRDFNISPPAVDWSELKVYPDRSYKALASFAARMDQVQPTYVKALQRHGLPNLSMYEVLVLALRDRELVSQVSPLPRTKAKILEWKNEAVYLLQLRHNYLPMMVMSRMTDFNDLTNFQRWWMKWTTKKVDLNSYSPAQLREWTAWLNSARETRQRLREIGIEPKYNKILGEILRSIDFGQEKILTKKAVTEAEKLQVDFAEAFTAITSDLESQPAESFRERMAGWFLGWGLDQQRSPSEDVPIVAEDTVVSPYLNVRDPKIREKLF